MQSIITKFLPCTNTKQDRVKAMCERGSITLSWDYALDVEPNHKRAIVALLRKFATEDSQRHDINPWMSTWACDWHIGALPAGGYVAVASGHADIQPEDITG